MFRKAHMTAIVLALLAAPTTPLTADAADAPGTAQPRASASGSTAQGRNEKAAELYRQANKLYDEKKLASAEALYREAWDLQKSYDIASNLGAVELDLGKPAAAAEMLSFALTQFPARGKPAERAALEARLARAKGLVCTLRITTNAAGAEIFVDGRRAGMAPLADDVFVDPGARTIEVKQKGHRDAKKTIAATPGARLEVALTLEAAPGAPVASAAPRAPAALPPPAPQKRSVIPAIAMGAAGVVAMGVGGALIGVAEASRSQAITKRDELKAAGVSCATPSAGCAELHDLTGRADASGNAGIGVMISGGALAAAGVAYFLWPGARPAKAKDTTLRASFGASPAGGGVTLVGSF